MNWKPKINKKDTKNESETKNKPKGYKKMNLYDCYLFNLT